MGERVDEACYCNMIEELKGFVKDMYENGTQMRDAIKNCASILGDQDEGTNYILTSARDFLEKYLTIATEAKAIADAMESELEAQRREREIWSSDSV